MNKKFLSAILFGALMVTSTGTFVSCKDYDDDIDEINTTLNDLKSQIAALQTKVDNGDYVTAVAKTADGKGMTFTFSKGSTVTIALDVKDGETGAPGKDAQQVTIDEETGELLIDGEGTGIFPAEDAEAEKAPVKIEGGYWYVLNENGEYDSTNIPVSGISVSGSEATGWVLTVFDKDGQSQAIELPTAASSITGITLATDTRVVKIAQQKFDMASHEATNAITKAADWNGKKGTKTLPNDGDYVFSSSTELDVRIDPVNVDATTIPFYLTNTKNADLQPIKLYAYSTLEDWQDPITSDNIMGRAAVTNNGLYTLWMPNVVVAKANYTNTNKALNSAVTNKYAYAVNAGHSFRSLYCLTVESETAKTLSSISLAQYGVSNHSSQAINLPTTAKETSAEATGKYEVGVPVYVNASEYSALYNMHLEADESDVNVYGLTFDQVNHTFTIGKNPDVSTVDAYFTLIVWTVDNSGNIKKTSVKVNIDTQLVVPTDYSLITHAVNKAAADNFFGIDLAIMKQGLGNKLDAWLQNVDLTAANVKKTWYSNENLTSVITPANGLFTYDIVKELKKDATATTDRNSANYIRVKVDNDKATYTYDDNGTTKMASFVLGKTYYVKVDFYTKETTASVFNSIVIPVKFTAPKLADLFAPKEGYVVDGVINAYLYAANKNIELKEFFKKDNYVSDASVAFDNETKIGETEKTSAGLAKKTDANANFGAAYVILKDKDTDNVSLKKDENGVAQLELGYGEALIMNVQKNTYGTWSYDLNSGDNKYQFKIRIQSPIFEGTVKPATGQTIEISANETVGFNITSSMIKGYDYNKNEYEVVPDVAGALTDDNGVKQDRWSNNGVVWVDGTPDTQEYVKGIEVNPATEKDGVTTKGSINVKAKSVSNDTPVDIYINVTDKWGYVKTVPVSITIKKN